ncbi:MAG: hypothetical protein QM779_06135 [Propionicimonas sp.]|uniref:hypothetical protein n=1 Tax=Propionicimonas sp. TaxID=1955623 RepID=UPI003D09BEBF
MRRGARYLPVKPKGRRRLGLLGVGVLAVMSLVWQQQATLASYVDVEYGKATFTAATLKAITPTFTTTAATVTGTWDAASGSWATPAYLFTGATSSSGANAATVYSGTATTATQRIGSGTPASYSLPFTRVAAGATHACGIASGTVYCWGTSASGGLGLGSTTSAKVPTAVTGGDLGTKVVSDLVAGTDFTCAVASGKAYCWGLGTNGQLGNGGQTSSTTPKAVSSLTGITSIAAGSAHACAVASGKAYCWGQGTSGQIGNGGSNQKESPDLVKTDGVLSGRTVASVAAGGSHSCAVADGQAFCWGLDSSGQLGNGSTTASNTPVAVDTSGPLMGRIVSVLTAGTSHTCAIADGKAFCWGLGTSGQLGNSASATSQVPVAVTTSTMSGTVTGIDGGAATTCAVAAGNAYCWGDGTSSGLGNGGTTSANAPVQAVGSLSGRTVTRVSAGTAFGCATSSGKPASCWGLGSSYQLGDNATANNTTPGDVTLSGKACPDGSVRASDTTCSLLQGTDYYYRLGYSIGTWAAPNSDWTKASTTTRPGVNPAASSRTNTSLTLGWDAAQEPGQAYSEYTVARSTSSDGSSPTTVAVTGDTSYTDAGGLAPSRTFSTVSAGDGHTCGIIGTDLYCWGLNSNGQLGMGDTNSRTVPTKVSALDGKKVTAVSAGTAHTCAIADAKVYCWGQGTSGQLGNGANNTSYVPVLVSNQTGTPTVVAAGTGHTCAIASGAAYCWGSNSDGQLGNNSTTNSNVPVAVSTTGEMGTQTVAAIAAGGAHTCAVGVDNRAYCWGQNTSYQLGSRYCAITILGICIGTQTADRTTSVAVDTDGAMGTSSVTSVTTGTSHTCAVAAGKAYCWGLSGSGQLGNGSTSTSTRLSQAVVTTTMSATVTSVSARSDSTCAIAGGVGYCWGLGTSGQLGNGASATSSSPVAVAEAGAMKAATVTSIASGTAHGCAVADGLAYCWGSGDSGRLGTRATTSTTSPLVVTADALCASGSTALGDGSCSLASGTTYYYRVTFTLDGNTTTKGDWTGIKTSS